MSKMKSVDLAITRVQFMKDRGYTDKQIEEYLKRKEKKLKAEK